MIDPFVHGAKAQTMVRDISTLRKAIRSFDAEAADKALDDCERWFALVDSEDHAAVIRAYSQASPTSKEAADAALGLA